MCLSFFFLSLRDKETDKSAQWRIPQDRRKLCFLTIGREKEAKIIITDEFGSNLKSSGTTNNGITFSIYGNKCNKPSNIMTCKEGDEVIDPIS